MSGERAEESVAARAVVFCSEWLKQGVNGQDGEYSILSHERKQWGHPRGICFCSEVPEVTEQTGFKSGPAQKIGSVVF